ncbi:MAG: RHS repeat-associated core domain-containing protein, partial [Planctomycetota bacterium]
YLNGWRQKVTNPLLEEMTYTNDSAGRVLSATDANTNTAFFGYDGNGRMTSVTPPGRPAHVFSFTGLDQQDTYAAPTPSAGGGAGGSGGGGAGGSGGGGAGGGSSSWTTDWDYDDDRQLDLVTYPGGDQLDHQYESATGRLDKVVTTNSGTRDHSYDAAGRLSRIDQDDGATPLIDLAYAYDGRLLTSIKWTIPDSPNDLEPELVFGYDDNFWVTTEDIKATSTSTEQFTYVHDGDGLITRVDGLPAAVGSCEAGAPVGSACVTYGTNVARIEAMAVGVLSESWSYSALGELQSYTVEDTSSSPATPVYSLTLERDDLGRITKKTEVEQGGTPIVAQYRYDAGGRLWKVWNDAADDPAVDPPDVEYTYDANGNRLSKAVSGTVVETGTYDGQDRVLTYGGWTYQHSARGEVISRTDSSFNTWSYDYDDFGSLIEVTPPSGAANAVGYEVDGKDRRVRRTVGGIDTNNWVWRDQLRIAADVDSSGLQSSFVSILGRNVPELMVTSSGNTYRLVTDHLGSVRMVVNVVSGALVESYQYDEFGVRTTGPASPLQPFEFAGGLFDIESGLLRYGARSYDPTIGRWLSKDPLIFKPGEPNLFRLTQGDPVNYQDTNGLMAIPAGGTGTKLAPASFDFYDDPDRCMPGPVEPHYEQCRDMFVACQEHGSWKCIKSRPGSCGSWGRSCCEACYRSCLADGTYHENCGTCGYY